MNKGYVKIYRDEFDNGFYFEGEFTRSAAWIDLILLAQYKSGSFMSRGILINYQRGDVTLGILELSRRWKWSEGKTKKFLLILREQNKVQIKEQKFRLPTIISIVNYNIHREQNEEQNDEQNENRMRTECEQNETINKGKESKESKKEKDISIDISKKKNFQIPTFEEVKAYCEKRDNTVPVEQFMSFYESNGWKVGKNPMKSWQAAVITWEKNHPRRRKSTLNMTYDEFMEEEKKYESTFN
jgi:hypothetical protein